MTDESPVEPIELVIDWADIYTATRQRRIVERAARTLGLSPCQVALLMDPLGDEDEAGECRA